MHALRSALIAALVLGSAGASVRDVATRAPDDRGRPLILVVHGRGQLGRDTGDVRRDALHALQNGAIALTKDAMVEESDVRLVWYADLLDEKSREGASARCSAADSLDSETAVSSEPNAITMLAAIAGAIVGMAADDAHGDDALDVRRFGSDLRYLADTDVRCAARMRVARALREAAREGRPVILVAHSFGAFVTWDHLRLRLARPGASLSPVASLVTMGSPLGAAELRQIVFGEEPSPLRLPAGVGAWTNVMGAGDPFAMRISDPDSASALVDVSSTVEQDDPHQLASYLHDSTSARVVLGAWCMAFAEVPGSLRGACGAVLR